MGSGNGSLSSNHRTTLIDRFYQVIFRFMSMKHHFHHRNLLSCPEKTLTYTSWGHFFTMSQNPIYTPAIFFPSILVFAAVCCPIHVACAQTDPGHSLLYISQSAQSNHDLRIPDQQSVQIRNPDNHAKQILLWHVILIGGFDSDPTKKQLNGTARRGRGSSGLYQLHRDLASIGTASRYFNWEGSDAGRLGRSGAPGPARIANYIRQYHLKNSHLKTAIIGASWGGYTALEVTELLNSTENIIPVETLILVDASAFFRNLKGLPPISENVMHTINYFTHNRISTGVLTDVRVENIDLGNSSKSGYHMKYGAQHLIGNNLSSQLMGALIGMCVKSIYDHGG